MGSSLWNDVGFEEGRRENGCRVSSQQRPPHRVTGLIQFIFPTPRESAVRPAGHWQPRILANEVSLEHSHSVCFHVTYGCFCSAAAACRGWTEAVGSAEGKVLAVRPFTGNVFLLRGALATRGWRAAQRRRQQRRHGDQTLRPSRPADQNWLLAPCGSPHDSSGLSKSPRSRR